MSVRGAYGAARRGGGQDCLDCLRGAVTIAFPEGLPDYDDVRQARALARARARQQGRERRGGATETAKAWLISLTHEPASLSRAATAGFPR